MLVGIFVLLYNIIRSEAYPHVIISRHYFCVLAIWLALSLLTIFSSRLISNSLDQFLHTFYPVTLSIEFSNALKLLVLVSCLGHLFLISVLTFIVSCI